ncbi:tetratricopeptide repeat protein [Thioflexithrix psekupsensis]|uniref:AAA+ ATPase domain-containing protein n=1 Tax=Thioflexithrix psekupsensis TaxID=1570016 RepID=A0A251X8T1_9GAMM|nr:tetratricopeptide repeat protein [Thioflexithrix psekupsensis]OUD14406.1 hypothetical protein TPSD3_08845 [Thioflexithrix psekupsensis]
MNFNKRLRVAKEKFEAGLTALNSAHYQEAVDCFLESAKLYKGIREQKQNYAVSLVNAANAYYRLGKYEEAKLRLDAAIPIQKKILGVDHPDLAASFDILASVYQEQDDHTAKAEVFYKKSLAIRKKHFGDRHPDVATSLNSLANVYKEQDNHTKAKEFYEEALDIRKQCLGDQHPDVAISLNNLANIYQEQNDYSKAILFYKESLAIFEKNFGSQHPNVAAVLNNLATLYEKQGDTPEAKELQAKALAIREGKLGVSHRETKQSLNNLANIIIQNPNTAKDITEIAVLHNVVLQFFMQQLEKTLFYFTLRTPRNDEQGRLSKGYWFLGEEEFLYFSFWKGIDSTNQMPTIALVLNIEQQLTIVFNGEDSPEKAQFLQDLTQLFDGFIQIDGEKRWEKTYSQPWENALEHFLIEKTQIDDYLTLKGGKIEDFGFIPEAEFLQSLRFIRLLSDKLKSGEIKQLTEIGKPLKLHSLQLENIGRFENLNIDLSRQITILIGENGSGKSSILKAIALALSGKAKNLDVELIQHYLRIEGTDEDGVKIFCEKGSIRLDLQINAAQSQIIELNDTELSGVKIKVFVDNDDEWLLATDNRFIDLVLGFPQGKKRDSKAIGNIVEPNLNDVLNLIEDRDISKWKADLVEWIVALYREPDAGIREKNLVQIQWVFDIFSKIISDTESNAIRLKTAVHDPATGEKDVIICTPDMPEGISLDLLSQGYTNIFIWVGRLVMRLYAALSAHQTAQKAEKHPFLRHPNARGKRYEANTIQDLHGIILIDEIDTYLHPMRQRSILRVLVETFPCLQFIVTSHSPMVLGYLRQWKQTSVYKIKDNVAIPVKHFYGRNEIDLFFEFYGIEARPPEIQRKIDDLYDFFDQEQLEPAKELLNELQEILGDDDPIVNELSASIHLMEKMK